MKRNLIALAITTAILSLAIPTGVRAEDKPDTSTESGGGTCGGCEGGQKHHKKKDKDADKGEKPAPTPAQPQ